MGHPPTVVAPGSVRATLADRAVPLAVVTLAGLGVAAGLWAGLPPVVLLALAAAPLALLFSYRAALGILVVALVARAVLDNAGNQLVTGGIAAGVIALAIVVLVRTPGWAAPVLAIVAALFGSAFAGAGAHGGENTYTEALRLVSCLGVVVVAVNAPGRLTLRRVAHVVQAVALVPAVLAVQQFATGTGGLNNGVMRSAGSLAHPNSAAVLFALAAFSTFALLLDSARRRWVHAGLLATFLVAQVSTGSIGGLVTLVVMVVVYLGSAAVRRADRILLGLLGLALGAYAATTSRVGAARLAEYSSDNTEGTSLDWRIHAWANVLGAWRRNPVLGNGIGATQSDSIIEGNIPHNEYVRLLAETGVVGLAVVVGVGLWFALRLRARMRSATYPAAAAFGLAIITGLAVNSLAANTMLYSVPFYVALFAVGACWRITRPREGEDLALNGGRWVTDPMAKSPTR